MLVVAVTHFGLGSRTIGPLLPTSVSKDLLSSVLADGYARISLSAEELAIVDDACAAALRGLDRTECLLTDGTDPFSRQGF
jgi:hypothetical protein